MTDTKEHLPGLILIAALIGVIFAGCSNRNDATKPAAPDRYDTAEARTMIAGIKKIEGVAWVKRRENSVHVGWNRNQGDLQELANAWAMQLNVEWDFGAHVWMLPAKDKELTLEVVYAEATARYGKIR